MGLLHSFLHGGEMFHLQMHPSRKQDFMQQLFWRF